MAPSWIDPLTSSKSGPSGKRCSGFGRTNSTRCSNDLARAHCADGSARQALERMYAAGDLPYRGTRRHRGNLCPKCFFYRRVSDADEGCDAYEKWLVDPPVKREQCEQFIS